jgi:uncharacterized protein (DUF1778 family)
MAKRVQVILEADEKERLQRQARLENTSLSMWIRRAALERLASLTEQKRFTSVTDLRSFFTACDEHEAGTEPDWEQHLEVMHRSVRESESGT